MLNGKWLQRNLSKTPTDKTDNTDKTTNNVSIVSKVSDPLEQKSEYTDNHSRMKAAIKKIANSSHFNLDTVKHYKKDLALFQKLAESFESDAKGPSPEFRMACFACNWLHDEIARMSGSTESLAVTEADLTPEVSI